MHVSPCFKKFMMLKKTSNLKSRRKIELERYQRITNDLVKRSTRWSIVNPVNPDPSWSTLNQFEIELNQPVFLTGFVFNWTRFKLISNRFNSNRNQFWIANQTEYQLTKDDFLSSKNAKHTNNLRERVRVSDLHDQFEVHGMGCHTYKWLYFSGPAVT